MSWPALEKGKIVFIDDARKLFCDADGKVDWKKVQERWDYLKTIRVSLANKYWTPEVCEQAKKLDAPDQVRLLNIMMGGLCNEDSGVGAYATRPEDYDQFSFFL